MKIIKSNIFLGLLSLFLLSACSPSDSDSDTNSFQESNSVSNIEYSHDFTFDTVQTETFHGVTYNVPHNWVKTINEDNPEFIFYYPDNINTSQLMVAFIEADPEYITNSTISSNYFNDYFSSYSEYIEYDRYNIVIDNSIEGVASSYSSKDEDINVDWDLIVFPSDNGLLTFVIGDSIPYEYDHSKDFFEVVKSIRFISSDNDMPQETILSEETEEYSSISDSEISVNQESDNLETEDSDSSSGVFSEPSSLDKAKEVLENSTFSFGQYKIGTDMPSGEYILIANDGGYFCVSSDSNGDDILFNDNFETNSIITVYDGEYLELSRCIAYPFDAFCEVYGIDTSNSGIMLKIGVNLDAGEYKLESTDDEYYGYYCIYDSSRHENIIANDNFTGQTYVTVSDGQYLLLNRCTIVQ